MVRSKPNSVTGKVSCRNAYWVYCPAMAKGVVCGSMVTLIGGRCRQVSDNQPIIIKRVASGTAPASSHN